MTSDDPGKPGYFQKISKFVVSKEFSRLVIVVGIGIFLRQYLFNRSLWYDEAAVSLDIIRLPVPEFFHQPLAYNQAAPVGFLLIQKILVTFIGTGEYVLRAYPFACAVASLCLFSRMARLCLGAELAFFATAAFMITPSLAYYASEAKPYATDVFFVLMSYVAIAGIGLKELDWRKATGAGLLGALMIWFSYPVIFILCGMGMAFLAASAMRKDRVVSMQWGTILFCWLASFAAYYFFVLHHFLKVDDPGGFWKSGVISCADWNGSLKVLKDIFKTPLGMTRQTWLAWALLILGGHSYFKKNKPLFLILVLPILLVLFISSLQLYSLRGRLALFLVPALLLLIFNGAGVAASKTGKWRMLTLCLLMGVLFYGSFVLTCKQFIKPEAKQDVRGALVYVQQNKRPGDVLFIHNGAVFVFEYYHAVRGLFPGSYIEQPWSKDPFFTWGDELKKMQGFKRVWMLFACDWDDRINGMNDKEQVFGRLVKLTGPVLDRFSSYEASVLLVDRQ